MFLGWVTIYPSLRQKASPPTPLTLPALVGVQYRHIGVAVEFTPADETVLVHAAALARHHGATLTLLHVVEGPGADLFGPETADRESESDRHDMAQLVGHIRGQGLDADGALGFGRPADELVRLVTAHHLDVLVLGTHGHRFLADLALGSTVAPVLHRLTIPVVVVPSGARVDRVGRSR